MEPTGMEGPRRRSRSTLAACRTPAHRSTSRIRDGSCSHAQLLADIWDPEGPTGEPAAPLPSRAGQTEPRPTNIYAATKLAQEHMLAAWTAAHDTSLRVLRLQNVYGPGQSLTNSYT